MATTGSRAFGRGLVLVLALVSTASWGQRAGQSVSVQYGTVAASRPVELSSAAVPTGVVVGGTLGLLSAGGKSTGKKVRNSIIGGVAGGAIAGSAQGSTRGTLYDVNLGSAGMIQVVTDQQGFMTGDCVAVEKAGETANLRRVSAAYCNPANTAAVASVAAESREEAEECLAAKQQLVAASTAEALSLARTKVELLCDD